MQKTINSEKGSETPEVLGSLNESAGPAEPSGQATRIGITGKRLGLNGDLLTVDELQIELEHEERIKESALELLEVLQDVYGFVATLQDKRVPTSFRPSDNYLAKLRAAITKAARPVS